MPKYIHICDFCHNKFPSARSHAIFCTGSCRLKTCRLKKRFVRIETMLPEELVTKKYYKPKPEEPILMILWFSEFGESGVKKRFADVYLSNECSYQSLIKISEMHEMPARIYY